MNIYLYCIDNYKYYESVLTLRINEEYIKDIFKYLEKITFTFLKVIEK